MDALPPMKGVNTTEVGEGVADSGDGVALGTDDEGAAVEGSVIMGLNTGSNKLPPPPTLYQKTKVPWVPGLMFAAAGMNAGNTLPPTMISSKPSTGTVKFNCAAVALTVSPLVVTKATFSSCQVASIEGGSGANGALSTSTVWDDSGATVPMTPIFANDR